MPDGDLFERRVSLRERTGALFELANACRAITAERVEPLRERAITAGVAPLPGEDACPTGVPA